DKRIAGLTALSPSTRSPAVIHIAGDERRVHARRGGRWAVRVQPASARVRRRRRIHEADARVERAGIEWRRAAVLTEGSVVLALGVRAGHWPVAFAPDSGVVV